MLSCAAWRQLQMAGVNYFFRQQFQLSPVNGSHLAKLLKIKTTLTQEPHS